MQYDLAGTPSTLYKSQPVSWTCKFYVQMAWNKRHMLFVGLSAELNREEEDTRGLIQLQ